MTLKKPLRKPFRKPASATKKHNGTSRVLSLPIRSRQTSVAQSTPTPAPQSRSCTSATSSTPRPNRYRVQIQASAGPSSTPLPENGIRSTSNAHEIEQDPDADDLNEVVMAVNMRERGTVGCAYYLARQETLYVMEDVQLGSVEVVEARKWRSCIRVILQSLKTISETIRPADCAPCSFSCRRHDARPPQSRTPRIIER